MTDAEFEALITSSFGPYLRGFCEHPVTLRVSFMPAARVRVVARLFASDFAATDTAQIQGALEDALAELARFRDPTRAVVFVPVDVP